MPAIPIRPHEIHQKRLEDFPDAAIEAFNELIVKHWNGSSATFKQDEVLNLMAKKLNKKTSEVFIYLNVEDLFEKFGWKVEYDKPGLNEDYSATFTFRRKK